VCRNLTALLVGACVLAGASGVMAQPEPADGYGTPGPAPVPAPAPAPAPMIAPTHEQLVAQLRAPDPALRQSAALQLGRLGDGRAIDPLIQSLYHDSAGSVRAAAARALGELRAQAATGHLQRAAQQDPDPEVRTAAASALGTIGGGGLYTRAYPSKRDYKMHRKAVHEWLLQTDPEYRSAVGTRTTGIVLASVVGGGGLLVGVTALFLHIWCSAWGGDCDDTRNWMIGGFVSMVVGTAVGIPVAVSGHSRAQGILIRAMSARLPEAITARLPDVRLSFGAQGGGLSATWEF